MNDTVQYQLIAPEVSYKLYLYNTTELLNATPKNQWLKCKININIDHSTLLFYEQLSFCNILLLLWILGFIVSGGHLERTKTQFESNKRIIL